ncbi:MAG TPA: trypsin-like peptidase domain-containing protein [Terracidiphilus sp.]|nr:trypsin-like peptidase domain-containing protein [Terracidiphilus sp.]
MKRLIDGLRRRRLSFVFVLLATLSVAIVAVSFAAHGVRGQQEQASSGDATPLKVVNSPVAPNEFVKIARAVAPAVVNINTRTLPKQTTNRGGRFHGHTLQQNPGDNGGDSGDDGQQGQGQGQGNFQDFFNRFFGGQAPDQGEDGGGGVQESLGSGFIVDPRGYIITNYHVIEKADQIYVKLASDPDNQDLGRPARVIGTDKATDLAVIKIDADKPLPTVKLGNSEMAQVGDWVEAIGSPFDLTESVTAGIISAKNRTLQPGAPGQFQHFIQTDAAINPGNSGGPLLNMNGDVIGVNTAILTQSAGYEGVGFAMPSNTVVAVYNDLISPGHKVVRGSLGVSFAPSLSAAVNRVYGFKNGVLVQEVQPGGPADKAGLLPGDIITTVDGRAIKDGDDLVNEIAARRPGTTAQIGYSRDNKAATTTITVGDRDKVFAEASAMPSAPDAQPQSQPGQELLGITVREAGQETTSKLHIPGMLVQSVRPGSFADLQGVSPGMVIIRINRRPTGSRQQYDDVVSKLKSGDDVVFEVMDPAQPASGISYIGGTLQ